MKEFRDAGYGGFRTFTVCASAANTICIDAWFFYVHLGRVEVIHAHSKSTTAILPPVLRPFLGIMAPFPHNMEQYLLDEFGVSWSQTADCKKIIGHNCAGPTNAPGVVEVRRVPMLMRPLPNPY